MVLKGGYKILEALMLLHIVWIFAGDLTFTEIVVKKRKFLHILQG
jgi:hypothetical protein